MTMSYRFPVLSLLVAAVLFAGCAWNEPVSFDDDPRVDAFMKKGLKPHPYRLAVAPIRIEPKAGSEEQEGHFTPPVRSDELTGRMVEAVKKLGLFREVVSVGEKNPEGTVEDHLTEAWEKKADLLLALDVSRYEVYWVGTNGLFIPNIIWWSFGWALSGYVDDERYGGGMDIQASLYSVHSNQKIDTWSIRKDVELDLNDFERGWMLLGWLRVPGSLDEENWRKVEEVVCPRTEIEVKLELADTLGESFKSVTGTSGFAEKMSKRLALVVGIDRWDDYRLNWTRFAGDDAKAMEKILTEKAYGIGIPAKNMRVLVNEQATAKGISDAIVGFLADRATAEDQVIIYYAGYGASTKDGKDGYLLAFDSKIDQLDKTALKLSSLKKALDKIKAKNVTILLDTAFNADEALRSATKNILSGASITLDEGVLSGLGKKGRVLALACGPNEGAQLFAPKKHGMFTYFLTAALDPKTRPADKNKDGAVSYIELLDYASKSTVAETELAAVPQSPVTWGEFIGKPHFAGTPAAKKAPPKKAPKKAPAKKAGSSDKGKAPAKKGTEKKPK